MIEGGEWEDAPFLQTDRRAGEHPPYGMLRMSSSHQATSERSVLTTMSVQHHVGLFVQMQLEQYNNTT